MEQSKERILDILYQQLQLLAEKIDEEEDLCCLSRLLCDFRFMSMTILENEPTEEQIEGIFKMLNHQIELLSEKKSVCLSDAMNNLAICILKFF